MTSYTTCINCAADKATCERREQVRAAIKGAGITSLKFKCDKRQSMFHVGQRVAITWEVQTEAPYSLDETWPGTVVRENGTRFVVAVDDVPSDEGTPARDYIKNDGLFVKVAPHRLQALDEPDRSICGYCERTPIAGDACDHRDADLWRHCGGYPPKCLAHLHLREGGG
jgi:hypothetical protein